MNSNPANPVNPNGQGAAGEGVSAVSAAASPTFSPLYQQIKGLITQSLESGEWKPGEIIPSEVELAARFKVSQGTVRKAIDELAADNLLVRRQGKGTFVATHNEELDNEMQTVYDKYYFSYYTSKPRMVRHKRFHDEFREPSEILNNYGFEDIGSYGFCDVSLKFYDVTQTFSADEYIALLETFSDHRHLPEENRTALYAGVKETILKHGGYLKDDDVFQLYMGRKP